MNEVKGRIPGYEYSDRLVNSKEHTTHFICDEIMSLDIPEHYGCCCTGHVCAPEMADKP